MRQTLVTILIVFFSSCILSGCEDNVSNKDNVDLLESVEKRKYNIVTESFEVIEIEQLDFENVGYFKDKSYIYIGRITCPACREFIFKLNKEILRDFKIYYINTDVLTDEGKKKLMKFDVEFVPSIIRVSNSRFKTITINDFERVLANES